MSVYLTTKDNPFSPADDFLTWYKWDESNGYHTCSYLDRIAYLSDSLSPKENDEQLEEAIDKIIADDPFDIYTKLTTDD